VEYGILNPLTECAASKGCRPAASSRWRRKASGGSPALGIHSALPVRKLCTIRQVGSTHSRRRSQKAPHYSGSLCVMPDKPRSTSALGIGVGWHWVVGDAAKVRQLLVFLEDRRALTDDHRREDVSYVVDSVFKIREQLTETLQELAPNSGASNAVRALRDACLVFLNRVDSGDPGDRYFNPDFPLALGELRQEFAKYLLALVDHYKVSVHGPLETLIASASVEKPGGS
jgi:hypothetical protein